MEVILPLDQMTTAEKLHAMEAIWENLSRNAESFESPAWHADILREREQRIADGKEVSVDWEEAKRQLRERHL